LPASARQAPLGLQIETGSKDLKYVPVVLAARDHRAEHRREGVARHIEPVGPRLVLGGLVDEGLADIEYDGAYRSRAWWRGEVGLCHSSTIARSRSRTAREVA
jgi:hypothetical protein